MKIVVNCISELPTAANKLLRYINESNIICLYGEMGVGKTTLIKEICKCLGVEDVVSSPTFSIINQYLSNDKSTIYHFDFYRLKNLEEGFDIGCEEYFLNNNLCLIEWPEKIEEIIPQDAIKVSIIRKKEQRTIEIFSS